LQDRNVGKGGGQRLSSRIGRGIGAAGFHGRLAGILPEAARTANHASRDNDRKPIGRRSR
jgi:hypothetical protein